MIRKEDFIQSIGMPDESFGRAVDTALLQISMEEDKPIMRKKLKMTLAAAIIALLLLTGAALGVSMNLFDFFGRYDERLNRLAPQAELETVMHEIVQSESLGMTHAAFKNGYYDGQSLLMAFTIENGERYESFEPTPEMLTRMEKADERYWGIAYDENTPGAEAVKEFLTAQYNGRPFGFVHYSVYPSDHCDANGVDLPPWQEYHETLEDGSIMYLREFESPLPETVQNKEKLELEMRLWQMPSYFYFDGENCYQLYEKAQPAGSMTAIVHRTLAAVKHFSGETVYNGVSLSVSAQVSAVRAEVKLTAGNRAFPYPGADSWYDALLIDEDGNSLRAAEANFEGDSASVTFIGNGSLPDKLTLYIGVDREGEWNKEDFKMNAAEIELTVDG